MNSKKSIVAVVLTGILIVPYGLRALAGSPVDPPANCPSFAPVPQGYEKPKTPVINKALEHILGNVLNAQEEIRALYTAGKVKRFLGIQGMWQAYIKFPNGDFSFVFKSETGPVLGVNKFVYTDETHTQEVHELGYEIQFDNQNKIESYRPRTSYGSLTFYPNGSLKTFAADIGDRSSGEASWDAGGRLLSEGMSSHLPQTENALPELEDALRHGDDNKRSEAQAAMAEIGPASMPYAMNVLKDGDEPSREQAAFVFGLLGEKAASSVPDLIRRFREDKSPKVRSSIASSLGSIGRSASAAIPALEEATTNADQDVANAAKTALSFIRRPSSQ